MAIYHFDASVISRSKGRSATAAAAYRTAARVADDRTGEVHDYTRKGGVLHTEIVAPADAPAWAHDRSALWNAVEQIERRKDAQVAREVRVALPSELSTEQNADLVRAFVQEQFVARGMIADVALHAPGREGDQRNHHAHIMLTTREIAPEGFGAKNRDWNAKDLLQDWRQSWAEHVNDTLERNDIHERVDHRTLEAQRDEALTLSDAAQERGDDKQQVMHMARAIELDRPPQTQMTAGAWSMMRRGVVTPAAERWQEAKQIAAQVREVAHDFQTQAVEWLGRAAETVGVQSALERLKAAKAERAAYVRSQEARERLSAAKAERLQQEKEPPAQERQQRDDAPKRPFRPARNTDYDRDR